MRFIGAGLAVFLAVTVVLMYQVTSDGNETAAVSVAPSMEPTATLQQVAPSLQPTRLVPTATVTVPRATATPAPTEPVVEPAATEVVTEVVTAESDGTDEAVGGIAPVDEFSEPEDVIESEQLDESGTGSHLAATDPTDAWSGAIETPNGGRIGMVASGLANVRTLPAVDGEIVDTLHAGWPVAIYGVVSGDWVDGTDIWYQVSGGGYVSAALIGPYIPRTPEVYYTGHWVDIDLTHNVAIAYIDDVPVNAVIVITGKAGFETPVGEYTIFARVESETLDSATVGIPEGDPEYYYLPDVPYTQYFAAGGFAIHANYWSDPWQYGTATSHGCVNMMVEDAAWFWWFLDVGSAVSVSY